MPPQLADLRLLAAHHSAPSYRELRIGMGKQGWHAGKWDNGGWDSASSQWSRTSWKPQKEPRGDAANKMQAIGYKNVQVPAENAQTVGKGDGDRAQDSAMSTTQLVQRAVNQARKAGTRHKKILEEMQWCQAQWDQYCKEMKAAYLKQQAAFQKDIEKLEEDAEKTKEQALEAERRLKSVLDSQRIEIDELMAEEEPTDVEEDGWDQLIGQNAQGLALQADKQIADYLRKSHEAAKATVQTARDKRAEKVKSGQTLAAPTGKTVEKRQAAALARDGSAAPVLYGPSPATRKRVAQSDPYTSASRARHLDHVDLDVDVGNNLPDGPVTPVSRPQGGARTPRAVVVQIPTKTSPGTRRGAGEAGIPTTIPCYNLEEDEDKPEHHIPTDEIGFGRME